MHLVEDATKSNVFMDSGSQSIKMSSLNEHTKSSDHVIATVMYHAKIQSQNANTKVPMDSFMQEVGSFLFLQPYSVREICKTM